MGDSTTTIARRERRAVVDIVVASVLFGGCNIAWRFGDGPAIGIVGFRTLIGAAVAVVISRRMGAGSWRAPLRSRAGREAVLASILGLVAAGTMFRSLDGPLAGLAVACTPAVALLVRDRSGRLATGAALGSSLVAIAGLAFAAGGGIDAIGWDEAIIAVVFVAVEVWSLRAVEVAVVGGEHPAAIVSASMIGGALVLVPIAFAFGTLWSPSTFASALGAAAVVAVLGTIGRVLRSAALPSAGVAATASSSQINAVVTAVGGVVLLGDVVHLASFASMMAAAALGIVAVVSAAHWRISRDPELAAPLDDLEHLRPDPQLHAQIDPTASGDDRD